MNHHFLFLGFGYTAEAMVPALSQSNFSISGTHRAACITKNSSVNLINFNSPLMEDEIAQCSHILISIPPTEAGIDIVLSTYSHVISAHAASIKWIGYLSSTGVYGDHHGDWVNEESACHPVGQSAVARFAAENAWLEFANKTNLPLHIFRLAGIYGSGRNAIARILCGKKQSIFKQGHYFSRIHVDDIANVLMASVHAPRPFSIYNVADDEPTPAHVVDEYAAKLLGMTPLPLVPFDEAVISPMERQFYSCNRRVSNKKIKCELQIALKYPSYREGLDQIWVDNFSSS